MEIHYVLHLQVLGAAKEEASKSQSHMKHKIQRQSRPPNEQPKNRGASEANPNDILFKLFIEISLDQTCRRRDFGGQHDHLVIGNHICKIPLVDDISQDLFIYFEYVKAIREGVHTNIHWVSGYQTSAYINGGKLELNQLSYTHWLSEDSNIQRHVQRFITNNNLGQEQYE